MRIVEIPIKDQMDCDGERARFKMKGTIKQRSHQPVSQNIS